MGLVFVLGLVLGKRDCGIRVVVRVISHDIRSMLYSEIGTLVVRER